MRLKLLSAAFSILFITAFSITSIGCTRKAETNVLLLPSLPRPIAEENVLITSAGQCTDTYIIRDIANQLMIHNFFMPQAIDEDLDGVKTIVFVIGYSPIGTKLHNISYSDEKERIEKLLKRSVEDELTIITVYVGGKERRGKETDELLKLLCQDSDYMIGTKESNYDSMITELAKDCEMPITLVNGVNDISAPFASAFR